MLYYLCCIFHKQGSKLIPMSKNIPVQFELPKAFTLNNEPEHIPPATHDPAVANERRQAPAGTLVLEQQHQGAMIAGRFAERLVKDGSHEDLVFGTKVLAAALLGSARHSLQGGRPVMRRHLKLPIIADPETNTRLPDEERIDMTIDRLRALTDLSRGLYLRRRTMGRVGIGMSHAFGRAAGESALWVALLPHDEIGQEGSAFDTQHTVRQVAMNTLDTTRRLGNELGANLSLAMLGGPTTNLTAYIERRAPHGAYNALQWAQSDVKTHSYLE